MPLRLYARLHARLGAARARLALGARLLGRQAGFSTAEGLAGAALAVVALIAIWAAMKAFGLDIIRWMQDQITSAGGGAGGP
ncbi:MAG TPA: hypothetical protein VE776_12290 [Actinomycetota bacterium]|jgi:hypothetical protein|nr:hypothetical protein [Actinomycetota bacterium]